MIIPPVVEAMSDEQALVLVQYLSTYYHFTPLLDNLKLAVEEQIISLPSRPVSMELHQVTTTNDIDKRFEQLGRNILMKTKRLSSLLCSSRHALKQEQKKIHYALHNYLMQLLSPLLIPRIHLQYDLRIAQFNTCRLQFVNVTLQDLRLPTTFHCNVLSTSFCHI